ncbi:MAG TPA: bifunctional demethylmenaquinone methyltransferase/2-methoxy-6-polyprenyl-1,4-benzoquinol methylase UbiE [Candidatus Acidoferrum sp.]
MPDVATQPTAPPTGTRFKGASSEADAGRKVRDMFSQIAPRYDLLNHLLSLQLDRLWRARATRKFRAILARPDAIVLDLCCGTGDLAFSLQRPRSTRARIVGADFSHPMLVRARSKSIELGGDANAPSQVALPVFEADALTMPFADDSFDLITTAFGFRNLANYEAGLREIHRLLKPGGSIAILEFTEPPRGVVGDLYRWYFRNILPRIGAFLSGDAAAYTYLPASVSRFFRPQELAALMNAVGFESPGYSVWTLGTVALHTAVKPQRCS